MSVSVSTSQGNTVDVSVSGGNTVSLSQTVTTVSVAVPSAPSFIVTEKGPKGDTGETGAAGPGFVAGGTENQFLQKNSATSYDTKWSAYTLPAADGEDGQVLTTNGAATVTFAYPKTIAEDVKNVSGGPLTKGTPVHVTGSVGNLAEVIAADAATNYPAHFVLNEDLADDAEGLAIALGFINNVDVPDASIYTEGQTVYLGESGGWTTTKPTGANAIQNLGIIIKVNTSGNKISGIIMGAGRANDVPNIATGNIWAGNADGVATATSVAYIDIANSKVGIGTTTPAQKLDVNGIALTKGVRAESTTDYSLITRDSGGNTVLYVQSANTNTNQSIAKFNYGSTTANSGTTVLSVGKDISYFNATNVGIGTTTPNAKLDVAGDTNATTILGRAKFFSFVDDYLFLSHIDRGNGTDYALKQAPLGSTALNAPTGQNVTLNINNSPVVSVVGATSNVGIGTGSPAEKLDVSGRVQAERFRTTTGGSAAFAAYYFQGDSDTGTFQPANNMFGITTAGTERMRIDSSGRVGIGTTTPDTELHVESGESILTLEGSNSSYVNAAIQLVSNHASSLRGMGTFAYNAFTDVEWFWGNPYSPNDAFVINRNTGYTVPSSQNSPPGIGASAGTLFKVASSGNVGIGTTSPTYNLDVQGPTNGIIRAYGPSIGRLSLQNSTGHYSTSVQGNKWYFFDEAAGASRMVIDSSGNVGIGTTSPTSKLDVNGGVTASGPIDSSDSTLTSITSETARFNKYGLLGNRSVFHITNENASGDIRFGISGAHGVGTKMTLKSSGNFGIGTLTPAQKLEVSFAASTYGARFTRNDAAGSSLIEFANNAGVKNVTGYNAGVDGYTIGTSANTHLTVRSTGRVGIGTTSPDESLHVNGKILVSANDIAYAAGYFTKITSNYADNPFVLESRAGTLMSAKDFGRTLAFYAGPDGNTAEVMRVDENGNVGIKTTSPGQALHVVGNTFSSGAIGNKGVNIGQQLELGTSAVATLRFDADAWRLYAGGAGSSGEVFRVTETGNVGIGTDSPSYKLTSYDTTNDTFPIVAGAGLSTSSFTGIGLSGFVASNGAVKAAMVLQRVGNYGTGDIHFLNNSTENNSDATLADAKMTIKENGNVGIGTTSPSAKLDVVGLANINDGSNNVMISSGNTALTTGYNNTTVGYQAGYSNTSGGGNSFVGLNAGRSNTSGFNNSFVGVNAGRINTGGDNNSFFGLNAGYYSTGSANVLLGYEAGYGSATSAYSNTVAVGYQALYDLTTGAQNTAVGYKAGTNISSGLSNTSVGFEALTTSSTADNNSAFGKHALRFNTTGYNNTGVGTAALYNTAGGANNVAVGLQALLGNTSGSGNTAIGNFAAQGVAVTSTFSNTVAVGYQALYNLTTGEANTSVGYQAGSSMTSGSSNVLLGYGALTAAQGASNNVAIGRAALKSNVSGGQNIAIGRTAGHNTTGSGNVFIGYGAGFYETGSNKLYIANTDTTTPLIYGDFNLGEITINGDLKVSGGNLRADAVEINGRALTTPATGEYGAGSRLVTQFASGTVTAGKVYVANAGSWAEGDANAGSTSIGMIAVATDSASATEMLIEGVVKLSSNTGFSGAAAGTVLYLSTTAGELTTTAPSTAGEYVRVCGYVVNASTNEVFFSASRDWTAL